MFTKWKINLKGFEKYRFDEYGNLWRLPFINSARKSFSFKKISICKIKHRWIFSINGKVEKWSKNQIRPHLILDDDPIQICQVKDLPF